MEMGLILLILVVAFIFIIVSAANKSEETYIPPKPSTPHYTEETVTGHVYIVSNDLFPEYKKVGMTTREVEDRVREFNTAVPVNFHIITSISCEDPYSIEQDLHVRLDKYRVSRNKEWFKMEDDTLVEELENIEYINITRK